MGTVKLTSEQKLIFYENINSCHEYFETHNKYRILIKVLNFFTVIHDRN